MKKRKIRVGIIGCGKIALVRHIPEYAANSEAELAAYYDFVPGRAESLAARYGGRACSSLEMLLQDPEIDAVSVCTANYAHAEVSIAALQAGKHVLCEKPMAVTMEECEQMAAQALRCGKQLMIAQNQRLSKTHAKAKELLGQGVIGDVRTFKTCFGHGGPENWSVDSAAANWFFDPQKSVFGAMADLGVHKTDLISYLLDSCVCAVQATIATLDKRDSTGRLIAVDDNAVCIYHMENGALGTMTASWSYYGEEDNSTVLYGTKGIMKLYANPSHSIEVCFPNGEKQFWNVDSIQTNDHQTNSGVIDAFIGALVNEEPVPIGAQQVLAAMRTVFAALEASKTGQTVYLSRPDEQ